MDDLMFGAEEKRPFPDTDYKNGRVKAVRGRMLKKLMKYELKALLSSVWITLSILAGMTLIMCVLLSLGDKKIMTDSDAFDRLGISIVSVILYIYAVGASVIVPLVVSATRYYNNFFKDEGYLTFSIPATAEEHIIAKHLSGIIATAIGATGAILSIIIVSLCGQNFTDSLTSVTTTKLKGFSGVMYDIEQVLIVLTGMVGSFCLMGACSCFAQKFDKRKHFILRFVLIYVIITLVSSLVSSLGGLDLARFFATETGMHIGSILTLIGMLLVTVFCFWYERRTLKYKLNLK